MGRMQDVAERGSMLRQLQNHFDDMALAILVWMCVLPVVGLLVFPLVGLATSLLLSAAVLAIVVVLCWGMCAWKIGKS